MTAESIHYGPGGAVSAGGAAFQIGQAGGKPGVAPSMGLSSGYLITRQSSQPRQDMLFRLVRERQPDHEQIADQRV